MKNVLISSFDMEVGGVERSLISMLNNFDYNNYQVDLMLYSHSGDFMNLLPDTPTLLDEQKKYKTFRMSIGQIMKKGHLPIVMTRLFSKYKAIFDKSPEKGYKQMQYMWKYSLPFLPKLEKNYDVAISYLWPHYFVAEKVNAKTKIAWIHTDFSTVNTDEELDIQMWQKFDYIVAVSQECRNSFIKKYPVLKRKVKIVENITSPELVISLAQEEIENPMIHDRRFKLVTVARFSHAKGIDNAVRALKLLKDKGYDDIAWYVVGYGGDERIIRHLINKYELQDSFILLGKQINPFPFMKAADLYVQPSRYEGKAVTVGEAQILSKPVMITNYPTANSQVRNGHDGLICELSVEGIAEGIERLYLDNGLRSELVTNCNKTNFTNTKELENLYQIL
ncbi:glycosyltransferase [Fredinandcohnia sp. 179-A 10B2 NHS]|uniref:glycosyltransferase n=1 Tax=Fredinandcohnia sp. 179-A 10B2 NHS TaxID=3235176 RepID=UPI0039A1593E